MARPPSLNDLVLSDRGHQSGVKVSELSTHSVILNNVEKIPIKRHEELTLSELCPGSLSQ